MLSHKLPLFVLTEKISDLWESPMLLNADIHTTSLRPTSLSGRNTH